MDYIALTNRCQSMRDRDRRAGDSGKENELNIRLRSKPTQQPTVPRWRCLSLAAPISRTPSQAHWLLLQNSGPHQRVCQQVFQPIMLTIK